MPKRKPLSQSRSKVVRSIAEARSRVLDSILAPKLPQAARVGFATLIEIANDGEMNGGGRAAAARSLLDLVGAIGAAKVMEMASKQDKDGKMEVVVRYVDAVPADADPEA